MNRHEVAIALGSNLGESRNILASSLMTLDKISGIEVKKKSSWYQTIPIGPPQPDYINSCAILKVTLNPEELLKTLLEVEIKFGRQRREKWGARTLDLDVILFDNIIYNTPGLEIPHPRMRERGFVLVPLAEIAPEWVDPITGKTIKQLLQFIDTSGVKLL